MTLSKTEEIEMRGGVIKIRELKNGNIVSLDSGEEFYSSGRNTFGGENICLDDFVAVELFWGEEKTVSGSKYPIASHVEFCSGNRVRGPRGGQKIITFGESQ